MKYILSRRVDLKYLDPIHGSKCISLFPSRSFFNLNRSRKISSVVIETLLDRPAKEANLMNYPGENKV